MGKRLGGVLVALLFSGAPPLAVALATTSARGRSGGDRRPAGLRSAAWALLTWEMFVVLVGGGYWLHYLMGLVPGLVVLAAASAQVSPRRSRGLVAAYAYTACSTVAVLGWVLVHPIERPEESAISYLAAHARPGDTAVVAFGTPNILQGAGLQSPYPQLWSLPARVRDPDARELTDVLTGPEAPTWLVVSGRSVTTWGIDGAAANRIVRSRYERPRARRLPDLRAQGPPVTAGLGVDRPRTLTRPRVRVAAMAGFAALLVLWSLLIGIPNDTGGVVLWVWFGTIAWNIDAPRDEHLDFWRDWWRPLLVLAVYWLLRGLADEIGTPVHYTMPIRLDEWLGGGVTPTERLQSAWCGDPCLKTMPPRWYDASSPRSTPRTSWSG